MPLLPQPRRLILARRTTGRPRAARLPRDKRSYGLRRMRWLGLAKAGLQVRLAVMAYNLRRSFGLLVEQRA